MQKLMRFIVSAFVRSFSSADKPAPVTEKLKWMTLAEAREAMLKEKKPVLIDLHTDWCGWCAAWCRRRGRWCGCFRG